MAVDQKISGDLIVNGTVDGRDVATDGTKLDGIEALAEVNDPLTVLGPASAADNAIARYDSTTGKLIQDSGVFVDDTSQLGVGIAAPTERLHVVKTATGTLASLVESTFSTTQSVQSQLKSAGASSATWAWVNSGNRMQLNEIANAAATPIGEAFTIRATTGNVGIGNNNPGERLVVRSLAGAGTTAAFNGENAASVAITRIGNLAATDVLNNAGIDFRMLTSGAGATERTAARISSRLSTTDDATRDGVMDLRTVVAGALTTMVQISGAKIGFYGAAATAQATNVVVLTNSTGGTANNTLAACAACLNAGVVNNNFSDVAAKINAILGILSDNGLMAT